jgi:hypothetical protein
MLYSWLRFMVSVTSSLEPLALAAAAGGGGTTSGADGASMAAAGASTASDLCGFRFDAALFMAVD